MGGRRSLARCKREAFPAHATRPLSPTCEELEQRLLLSANLPGMHLVHPIVDRFDGQVIYLDFDGEEHVTYDGPVTVKNVDVPTFAAPGSLAGQEQAVIESVLGSLDTTFADAGVKFTTAIPKDGAYSTVYVGGNYSAFADYGSFLGLAEQVDVANQDVSDEAFVFSDSLVLQVTGMGHYSSELSGIIAHEAGHLLGYRHQYESWPVVPNSLTTLAYTVITTSADEAWSVYAADLDGDGDVDVLSASKKGDKIAWYKNLGSGAFGPQQVITTKANGAVSVYAEDLDGDGDVDVLSASREDDKIAWYENTGGGTFGPQQVITTSAKLPRSVYAADLDGDGDVDVLSASSYDDKIAWYENGNEPPTDIAFSNNTVPENEPAGTAAGTLSTTDPDAGDTHTYTLVSGTGDDDNGAFTISGNTLETTASFNYEAKNTYSIRVQTEDGDLLGGTYEEVFTVNVTDVDEPPTVGSLSVSAGSLMKSEELTLTAGDVDDDGTVAKVAFYHDANTNGEADDGELLGEDTDGADGWSYVLDTTPLNAGAATFLARARDDGDNWSDVASAQSTITPFALTWTSGDVIVTAYDMGGTIDMSRSDFRVRFRPGDSVGIELVGTNSMDGLGLVIRGASTVRKVWDHRRGEMGDVAFLATDGAMDRLHIKGDITGYDLNGQTLGGIAFAADVDEDGDTDDLTGIYSAANSHLVVVLGDLTGDIVIQAGLRRLRVIGDASDVDIVVGPAANARQSLALTFGTATNVNVSSEMPLRLVRAGQWLEDGQASLIQAPAMTKLVVKGDFQGDVDLGAAEGSTGRLGVAKITGDLSDSSWIATGLVGKVIAMGTVDGLTLEAGALGVLKLGDVQTADVTVTGGAGLIRAQRWSAGTIEAETIRKLYVVGSRRNGLNGDLGADVILTAAAGARTYALRRMVVAGAMIGATLTSNASLGTVSLRQMINSSIMAGVKDGVTGLPADAADFADAADDSLRPNLANLWIQGVAGQNSFVNSVVAAWSIGTARLTNVLTDTPASSSAFGLAASVLQRYSRTEDKATVCAWKSSVSAWPADDADDFAVVKIV